MVRKAVLVTLGGLALAAFGVLLYTVAWHAGMASAATQAHAARSAAVFTQAPPTLQELIPLPGPNQHEPGQGQGKDCKPVVLFYYQGRLYQLQLGGPEGQHGAPSSPPEYFPLTPYQGPQIPGLPFGPTPPGGGPEAPGFKPVNPRF